MSVRGGEEHTLSEMESKCALLLDELHAVIAEYSAPKVSDMCEDDKAALAVSEAISSNSKVSVIIEVPGV